MPTPSTLPIPSEDESFKQEARQHVDRIITHYALDTIREAILEAYLTGANAAFHMGYTLGQRSNK